MVKLPTTALQQLRYELGLTQTAAYTPQWRVEDVDDRFSWLFNGDRAVALLDRDGETFELPCHGPTSECPPAVVPKYYHIVSYEGARILFMWRLRGKDCGERVSFGLTAVADGDTAIVCGGEHWSDGTRTVIRLCVDTKWGAYVAETEAVLDARRVTTALEYCNLLPAAVGDSRPDRERLPFTFWQHPDGRVVRQRRISYRPSYVGSPFYEHRMHILKTDVPGEN